MISYIGDWRVRVLRPEVELEGTTKSNTVLDFWREFMELGAKVRAPQRSPSSQDFGIMSRLLKKYDRVTLLDFGRYYWQRKSQPYFDNTSIGLMVHFSHVLPDIEREV